MMDLPLHPSVKVLATHKCGLLALEKPTGIRAHPNDSGVVDDQAILQAPYHLEEEFFANPGAGNSTAKVYLLNRIDAATSGLFLVALNLDVALAVRALFARQRVEKTYLAIVKGRPPGAPNIWTDWLERSKNSRGRVHTRVTDRNMGGAVKLAKTRIQWMAADKNQLGVSLVRLIPYTGRTHQLRVQCAKRGCPIVGDAKYGDFKFNRTIAQLAENKRLYLHAQEVRVQFGLCGEVIEFKAQSPIPDAFEQLLKPNRNIVRNARTHAMQTPLASPTVQQPANKPRPRRRFI
jgi:23S rRNA-/tRNA-specific pseudouridylate synthase